MGTPGHRECTRWRLCTRRARGRMAGEAGRGPAPPRPTSGCTLVPHRRAKDRSLIVRSLVLRLPCDGMSTRQVVSSRFHHVSLPFSRHADFHTVSRSAIPTAPSSSSTISVNLVSPSSLQHYGRRRENSGPWQVAGKGQWRERPFVAQGSPQHGPIPPRETIPYAFRTDTEYHQR